MSRNIQVFIIVFFLLKIDQSIAQTSTQLDATKLDDSQQPIIYREYGVKPLPLENAIDPEEYQLGPGDRLRINISLGLYEELISKEWSVENIDNFVTIGPTGKLIIPKIGPISVLGKTLGEVDREVNERIRKVYKSAEVSINLIRFRQFKVLVYGAVNKPKFVKMAPVSRLNEAINNAGGLQKYADPERIVLIRDGNSKNIFLKEFLLNGDLNNNPQLIERDIIYVPFKELEKDNLKSFIEYNNNRIIITGFIRGPKILKFLPGYKVKDYIAMSGGILDIGSNYRSKIIRANGEIIRFANNEFVEPGDIIEVPESYSSILFGNTGFIQAVTSIATLILAYQATIN